MRKSWKPKARHIVHAEVGPKRKVHLSHDPTPHQLHHDRFLITH